jgi:hypothetical protein
VKGTLERVPTELRLETLPKGARVVADTVKEAAEQAIPAVVPDKERRVNEVVGNAVVRYVKDTLAQDFAGNAEWRDQKADEYPGDTRGMLVRLKGSGDLQNTSVACPRLTGASPAGGDMVLSQPEPWGSANAVGQVRVRPWQSR